jgi:hypothetical protein
MNKTYIKMIGYGGPVMVVRLRLAACNTAGELCTNIIPSRRVHGSNGQPKDPLLKCLL